MVFNHQEQVLFPSEDERLVMETPVEVKYISLVLGNAVLFLNVT